MLHVGADVGESGGEAFKGPCECIARVADEEVDKLHPFPVFLEGREEEGVFLGLFIDFNIAAEVSTKTDLHEDEGALFLVERGRVRWSGGVRDPPCMYEVRHRVMTGGD